MSKIIKILTDKLEPEIKRRIFLRVENMSREIGYLLEQSDHRLAYLIQKGWTLDRIEVICELNSFYQIVLGPLASSARERTGSFGEDIPILYGQLTFNKMRSKKLRAAHRAFMTIISGLALPEKLLSDNHASDIVNNLSGTLISGEY